MTKLLARILLAILGVISLGPTSPLVSEANAQARSEAHVNLHVDGMTCASCAAAVRTALRRLDGVSDATVSFDEKRARVVYDPSRVTPQRMVQAVNDLGYRARVDEENRP